MEQLRALLHYTPNTHSLKQIGPKCLLSGLTHSNCLK